MTDREKATFLLGIVYGEACPGGGTWKQTIEAAQRAMNISDDMALVLSEVREEIEAAFIAAGYHRKTPKVPEDRN